MSLRLSAALGTHPSLWFEIQSDYDFAQAKRKKLPKIELFSKAA
jgi:plasmid maintenance system antidote protein VapI